jgi:flagellar biosynthetic protein FlhB
MSDDDDSDDDKPYEATDRKLAEARRKGQLPFSADLLTAAGYVGFAGFAALAGAGALSASGAVLQTALESGLRAGVAPGDAMALLRQSLVALVPSLSIWFVVPAAAALLAIAIQGGQVFAPTRLAPSWNKISPLSTLRQRFGAGGLVEFIKGLVKAIIFTAMLGLYLWDQLPVIIATVALDPRQAVAVMFRSVLDVAFLAAGLALVVGIFDLVWQRIHHLIRNRMSRKELEDELRESEGDPMLKGQRRQAAVAIAMNQAAAAVPKADVVIVNPTHYAVALAWDRGSGRPPICVAKGVDEVAVRIRQIAAENGVPLRSDPPTARALHATVEVGHEIPRHHFKAVAAAIRFADRVRGKGRKP